MYTSNPVLDEIHRTSEWEEIQANNIGVCIQCGQPIIKDTPTYEGDEYIETEDGLVHWECWREYGEGKKEMAR